MINKNNNSKQPCIKICQSRLICIISLIVVLSLYLLAFGLNVVLSLRSVDNNLADNNRFISIAFTLFIILAPEYIFSSFYTGLKTNKKGVLNFFSILGIFFAVSLSLVSIWGTFETLYRITFKNIVTSEKKIEYKEELKDYKKRKESLVNSIEKTRDKILTMPVEYFTIRSQYENVLANFKKELDLLEAKKPQLLENNFNNKEDLSIVQYFNSLGISINGMNFLSSLFVLSAFGLEVFLILLSYSLFRILNSLSFSFFQNKKKIKLENETITDCIITQHIKFILNCLEKDNLTIIPIKTIINEKGVKKHKILSIIESLKQNNLIHKNGKRLILHTELANKLIQ